METLLPPARSVTFGRFNLPHPGHVDLIKRMLEVGHHAYVGISTGKLNNDYLLRREVLDQLCYRGGLDATDITFFPSSNPYDAVAHATEDEYTELTDVKKLLTTNVVFGVDQSKLGEKLEKDLRVKFIPNEVRVGSSTVIRYFLEIGEEQIVREIYHNDDWIFEDVLELRKEELLREKS